MSMMTVDGMASGIPTASLVDQLVSLEARQQKALQTRLSTTEKAAAAYRAINTKFDALRIAAEGILKATTWSPAKATSTAASVTTTVTPGAATGQLTFSVLSTAATHSMVGATTYAATSDPSGFGGSLEVYNGDGSSRGTVTIGGTGSLADTVTAINDSGLGLQATAVQVSPGQYRLQVTAAESGTNGQFSLGAPGDFAVTTTGADAHLKVGTGPGAYDVYSPTNTFEGLMPGATLIVTKPETGVTVNVSSDPAAVADSVQGLVDAANAALADIKKYADNSAGSKAVLAGDWPLSRLASQVLSAVSNAVGGTGSLGAAGIEVTREGTVTFDRDKFLTVLADDPALAQRLVAGSPAGPGPDGATGTADDIAAVDGLATKLAALSTAATDKTTGTLTLLAKGRDELADDFKDRIEAWDTRLEMRRTTLMRQFTAMEVALSRMQSQSTWLAGQLGSLPTTPQ